MVEKYNVVSIYSQDIQKYNDFYEPHNIKEAENFITAWDTFSLEHPGSSERIEKNGKTEKQKNSIRFTEIVKRVGNLFGGNCRRVAAEKFIAWLIG